jgi:hypothetical protein
MWLRSSRPRHLLCSSRVLEAQHQDIVKTKQERQDGSKTRLSIAEDSNSIAAWDTGEVGKAVGGCARGRSLPTCRPCFVGAKPTRLFDRLALDVSQIPGNIEGILGPGSPFSAHSFALSGDGVKGRTVEYGRWGVEDINRQCLAITAHVTFGKPPDHISVPPRTSL